MSDNSKPVELDRDAVEKAARAMLAEWDREGGEGFDPISWEDINEDDDGAQDSWRSWARVALEASGLIAEQWKTRALAAEQRLDEVELDHAGTFEMAQEFMAERDQLQEQVEQARQILQHVVDGYSVDPSSVCPICASIPAFLASTENG